MKTFKQFLEDIDIIDDHDYSSDDSDNTTANFDHEVKQQKKAKGLDGRFKPLAGNFSNTDFEILHFVDGKEDTIVLVHKKKKDVAVSIRLVKNTETVFGKPFHFHGAELLSSAKEYRRQGLTVLLYQAIANSGQYTLASSTEQTEGGVKTWAKLLKVVDTDMIFALTTVEYARAHYDSGEDAPESRGQKFVLIKGDRTKLSKAAYDSSPHRLLIIPPGLNAAFVKQAIEAK